MFRPPRIISVLALVFASLLLPRCSEDQVIEMETLERHLLLTWIALERNDAPRVIAYNAATQQDWSLLQRHYSNLPLKPALQQSAARVNLWMLNLRNAVRYDQPKRATMAINLMQNELRVLRPHFSLNHPADHLYNFYYQWQDVVAASNDPMMCLLEWGEYVEKYELAVRDWKAYLAARPRFSDTLFPGFGQNAGEAEAAALAMTRSLDQFATILKEADHTLAAEPSQKIDDLFFDYLAVITAYPPRTPATTAGVR